MSRWAIGFLLLVEFSAVSSRGTAAEPGPEQYLTFIRQQAAAARSQDSQPTSAEEWATRRRAIREQMEAAWGGFPEERGPVDVQQLGVLTRDGYRIEKLLIQTFRDVWMPALAYVPNSPGKHPAILSVHGHWKGAKVEPTVQSRAIGAAKLGFFVLAVDAFGAGERGIGTALGEYHGDMVGATLFPVGRPLSGVQVYENMRCVDYLQSRPEVNPEKIGITGASGGGNQTMYAGAWDERFGAVVPVCSVGNYQAYLGPACCMCEVVPGALRFTEEAGVLGLVAPRALMPCNVTQDGIQFSIREARKSLVNAQPVFDLLQVPNNLYHSTFRWKHDYHQPIREAMYGWMTQHLKGEGDGSPITEPAHTPDDPESLRLFPGDSRPKDWLTLPQFAAREGKVLVEGHLAQQQSGKAPSLATLRNRLQNEVLGGFPAAVPLDIRRRSRTESSTESAPAQIQFVSEPGIDLALQSVAGDAQDVNVQGPDVVLLLNLDGAAAAQQSPLAAALIERGARVVTLDLRATGRLALANNRVGRAPDHHTAEWALWIGRPLLGQWAWDVQRAAEVIQTSQPQGTPAKLHLVGLGPAGLVALTAAATSDRFESVTAVNSLASYITEVPYQGQYLGLMAPGILRDVGDVPRLLSLSQARRTQFLGGVDGGGKAVETQQLTADFQPFLPAAASSQATVFSVQRLLEPTAIAAALVP